MKKKAAVNVKALVSSLLFAIIGLVIILNVYGETTDDIQISGNLVNATGAPLAGLFASDSVIPLIFLGAGLIAVVGLAFSVTGRK